MSRLYDKLAASALRKRITFEEGSNGLRMKLMGKPISEMGVVVGDQAGQVLYTDDLPKRLRGMGLGKKLYGETIRRMPNQTLLSDSEVTDDAQRVWQSMAKRKGYALETNPQYSKKPDGFLEVDSASGPMYRARLPAASALALPTTPLPAKINPRFVAPSGPVKVAASALRKRIRLEYDDTGQFNVMLGDRRLNYMTTSIGESAGQVRLTRSIPRKFQGMGLGKKIYGEVMRRMPNQTLLSDTDVSEQAQRVWEGMAKRKGYTLETNPTYVRDSRGYFDETVGSGPMYRGRLPTKAALPGVPPTGLADRWRWPAPASQPLKGK